MMGRGFPGDFRRVLIEQFVETALGAVRDFIREDVPRIAREQEDVLNAALAAARTGDTFLGQPVIAQSADTITLLVRFVDVGVPGIESLKLRLARAAIEIERWINLTTSTRALLAIRDVPAYTIEIVQTTGNYEIAIGGGVDTLAGFQQYRASVDWKAPEIRFRGYLAQRDKGGFLIDVEAASRFAIPLGPSGLGLRGGGILYGEHFAPDLRTPGSTEEVVARMERATAEDYARWAKSNDLEKWWPVSQHIRLYGISTSVCDMCSCGEIVAVSDAGIAYVDYGPVILFGGRLKVLATADAGEVIGAIDVRSRSFFGRSSIAMRVIPWAPDALVLTGVNELSASLKDQDRTWWAMGGYGMDGCRLKVLDFLELWGGMRVVPLQGAAVRAGGRAEGKIEFIGTGGGFSIAVDMSGAFGWNPFAVGGSLKVEGHAWLKILGAKLGVGISGMLALHLPKPLHLRLDVGFHLSLPWPLDDVDIGATLFHLEDQDIHGPRPPLDVPVAAPLAYIHGPSGITGQLVDAARQVWPDVAFELPFQRNAAGSPIIVNPPPLAGAHAEAGITVTHRFNRLKIVKMDAHGGEVDVPGVAASWLLARDGERSQTTSRLAMPCNDPLGWLARFDYAEPGSVVPVETFRLQTFGAGPTEYFTVDAGTGRATVVAECVRVTSTRPLSLLAVPWAGDYGRMLTGSPAVALAVLDPTPGVSRLMPVKAYQLRLIGDRAGPPGLRVTAGTIDHMTEVRRFDDGTVEWAMHVSRQQPDYATPLVLDGLERIIRLAAVGYVLDQLSDVAGGTRTVLAPGNYRLHVQGRSEAHKDGRSAGSDWPPIARDFEVIRPPLRPYLKFATFGDERIFGVAMPGWNPNPRGNGFGHYRNHLGLIRARVSYLSRIYDRLWISPREGVVPFPVVVQPARDGTLAGSRASRQWEMLTGAPPAREEEAVLALPPDPGMALARIYFSVAGDGSDIDIDVPIDQWTYRVSAFVSPTEHLMPARGAIRWVFGPSGTRSPNLPAARPIPHGFVFATSPAARVQARWPLPEAIARLLNIAGPNASLGYLRILEWAGALRMIGGSHENVLGIAGQPELCLLLDRAASPVGLIVRTSEPCDWRRVDADVVTGDLAGTHCRFGVRLAPSSDGCACLMVLVADDVPVRVPAGELAIEVRFALAREGLARLTEGALLDKEVESFRFSFVQPFGPAWPI